MEERLLAESALKAQGTVSGFKTGSDLSDILVWLPLLHR